MKTTKLTLTEAKYLKALAKKHILLPTKYKKPLVAGWNKFYAEPRNIEKLLAINQEYSLRTGTSIGTYYFIAIDLDDLWAKTRINDVRYIETNQGVHRYILIKEFPKSCWLVNSLGNKIGELHSKGRFVVGIGSIHQQGTRYTLKGRVNLPWSLKFETLKEFQLYLKARAILTTPWGKKGVENVRDLQPYTYKIIKAPKKEKITNPKKLSKEQKYFQKKKQLEKEVTNHPKKANLNICYLCLVYFPKEPNIIKTHLQGKKHQKNWKIYQTKTFHKIEHKEETKAKNFNNFPPNLNLISKE